ncbi:MAG: lipoate--protein ligase [Syntrophomonadaceae bacterium]|nr:lipoate--protein ligase [Syntrophomonadaceae bacterium]MDD3023775.1 lipoate--protein ligase [Syntrophomonadaceae bacterium]
MIEIINPANDPYFNLALEEYAVKNLPASDNYFILWQNRPAVIIGRNQNTIEEINQDYIKEKNITVARRMSGGGAVYHDYGNLNFTLVVNENNDFANFAKFTRPVINTLKRLGIEAENNGRNDISIEGKKFSGNAQFKYKNRLMHHGTILFDTSIEEMVHALNPGAEKISSKGIKSVRSRVTNISEHLSVPVSIEKFKQILTEEVLREESNSAAYNLSEYDMQAVNQSRDNKYSSWEWIYGISPAYNIQKKQAFSWGNIDIRLEVKRGLISGCRIFGDYFASREISDLENVLIGIVYREEDVQDRLAEIDIRSFFPHIEEQEFIELLCKGNNN